MKSLCLCLALIALSVSPALAQQFTDTPVCSELINATGFGIYGSVETDTVKLPDGKTSYYKSNFRLKKDEKTQICSNGPFFEGQRLTLTLRSLVPLFECKTQLGQPITLNAARKKDGTGYDWSATCY